MNDKWGQKRKCPKCDSFFYDMGKKEFVCPKCKAKYTEDSYTKAKEKHLNKMVKREMPKINDEDLDTETLLKMTDSLPDEETGLDNSDNLNIEEEEDMDSPHELDEFLDDYSDEKDG
ncbi:MAG: FYDLN acid domain-containing protein [Alphaproteobacteria bacterium]|nr:FYDLN acid domain-containing protein [Alphaproteobacteria bacterium]